MKIVCKRQHLLEGISLAAAVAPARSTKAILSGILIRAEGKNTVALATDLQVAVCSRLREVIVEEPGDVVVTSQTLVEILRSIESDEVTITAQNRFCEIRSADAHFKLVSDDPEEFPNVTPADRTQGFRVPRTFVEELFDRTAFAAARDVGRYAINGVLVEIGEKRLRFVATDGRRLAVATRDLPDAKGKVQRVIVPVKGLHECLRSSEGEESLTIGVEPQRIVFSSEHADIMARPVEGEFPDYEGVLPKDFQGKVELDRDAFTSCVRKASVLRTDGVRSIRIRIDDSSASEDENLVIQMREEGRGEATARMRGETEGKAGLEIDFNPEFLLDYLKALPTGLVCFEYRDANGAAVFRMDGTEDRYVVMPITTN